MFNLHKEVQKLTHLALFTPCEGIFSLSMCLTVADKVRNFHSLPRESTVRKITFSVLLPHFSFSSSELSDW